MKKILAILVLVWAFWYLYNLWLQHTNIEKAKKELLNTEKKDKNPDIQKENKILEQVDNSKPTYWVKKLDNKNFIKLDDLTKKVENIVDKITITWKVLNKNVDKIVVSFSNNTSDFASDTYVLNTFKKWDSSFKYRADALVYRNIDYWKNKYIIDAYAWKEKSSLELTINIPENLDEQKEKKQNTEISYDKKILNDLVISLPENDIFGQASVLDNNNIIYSNIDNLEIEKKDNLDKNNFENSDNIWNEAGTGYLNQNFNSYVYWNSLRNIDYSNKQNWKSFYVLEKNKDKLVYKKLYFDFKNNLVWTLKIKEFDIDKNKKIWEQMLKLNKELKKKNDDFEVVKKTDKLFREIIR